MARKPLKVAVIRSSNSTMRNGYLKYPQEYLADDRDRSLEFSNFAIGGLTGLCGAIQNCRHAIAKAHDIILYEYCLNDLAAFVYGKYTVRMMGMALEGFIRQSQLMNPNCTIIILIFGTNLHYCYNHGCVTSAIYESVARRDKIPVIKAIALS